MSFACEKNPSPTPPQKGEGLNPAALFPDGLIRVFAAWFLPPCGGDGRQARGDLSRHVRHIALFLTLIFTALPAFAFNPDEVLSDKSLETRARALTAQLRCMVCQNQSIDDSNAELARDLRVLVRERLVNGDSDEAVINYVVSRYGEFVLLKPRLSARTMLLWGAPVLLIGAGVMSIFIFSRRRASLPEGKKLSDEEEARIRDLLEK
jgi:cytochrome c-type biogenesis protein CcmH